MMNEKRITDLNIAGVQEIDDLVAESVNAGAFLFNRNGGNAGPEIQGRRTIQAGKATDTEVQLNSTDRVFGARIPFNNRFALAIHHGETGQHLFQVRHTNNPGRDRERIDVAGPLQQLLDRDIIGINTPLNYHVRQLPTTCNFDLGRCFDSSDRRLKTDIKDLGFLPELGIKLYSWKYRNEDSTRYVGVMAQDLLTRPDLAHAVVITETGELAGYYAVNYEALGLSMTTEAEWDAKGLKAVVKPSAVCV